MICSQECQYSYLLINLFADTPPDDIQLDRNVAYPTSKRALRAREMSRLETVGTERRS